MVVSRDNHEQALAAFYAYTFARDQHIHDVFFDDEYEGEVSPESQSEGLDAIERGKFAGRCGFKLGDAIEKNAPK